MADYKDIIKGTLNSIAGKVKEVAESDTVQNFCGKVKAGVHRDRQALLRPGQGRA